MEASRRVFCCSWFAEKVTQDRFSTSRRRWWTGRGGGGEQVVVVDCRTGRGGGGWTGVCRLYPKAFAVDFSICLDSENQMGTA